MISLTNIKLFQDDAFECDSDFNYVFKNNYKIIYQLLIDYFINNGIKIKIFKTFV